MGWNGVESNAVYKLNLFTRKKLNLGPIGSQRSRRNMFLYFFLLLAKAFSMLANHVLSNMKIRKGEQRRDALLARLNVDTDQLLGEGKYKLVLATLSYR